MLKLIKENIPEKLREFNQWVGFILNDEGKKIPIDPKIEGDGNYAKISEPSTWGTFEQAVRTVEVGMCVGIEFAMTPESNLIFLDIDCHTDKCKTEEEKKTLIEQYKAMCRATSTYRTYQEKSFSGEGVHVLAYGTLDEDLQTGTSPIMPTLEIYTEKRFLVMTGHRINDFEISEDEQVVRTLRKLHSNYFQKKSPINVDLTDRPLIGVIDTEKYKDDTVLSVALKNKDFKLLWEGNWDKVVDKQGNQKYSQQHYADFALIRKLTFYTCNFPAQVERLFKQSPCYLAYGKNGKWSKYESDIKKDIQKASSTCTAVYSPMKEMVVRGADVVNTDIWVPDYQKFYQLLMADKDSRPIKNRALVEILKDYILKYQGQKNIQYIPDLFTEDRNINGATNIVKKVFGDSFKYSYNSSGYYIWDGKRYVDHGDVEILIHPITEIFALVEHSVFYHVMSYVVFADDNKIVIPPKTPKEDGKTEKDLLEEKAIKLFQESKRYVDTKLATDVLKKYKGMDLGNDIAGYYDSPYINMQNGVLNIETRELFPHDPSYNQHRLTNCDFDPKADCPVFEDMMTKLLPNEDDRKELQKAFGLCLAKQQLPAKKVLMLLVGPKDTGKTTLLNTVVELLGDYGISVDNSLLMQTKNDKTVGPEMLEFKERIMITSSESNESDKLNTGRVKSLTGQTQQSVRNNYATRMSKFKMIGLIFLDSNFKPYIPPKETATWDRLRLFPFVNIITQKDPTLPKKLVAEKAGIFNWLLKGLDIVLEEKEIFETPAMLAYKEKYKEEMDVSEQFINDCLEKTDSSSDRILTSVLFSTYKNWCKDNGFKDIIRNKFYEEINKSFEKKKSGSEYFISVKFTDLGNLYSRMSEKTSQQFAKDKRNLLENPSGDLPYNVLRQTYYSKSKEWFIKNIESRDDIADLQSRYNAYCSWCIDQRLIPLKFVDYNVKVAWIRKYLKTPVPTPELIEKSKDIWGD